MRLSEHFTLEELTASPRATKFNINNTPNAIQIDSLKTLCDVVLEPLRSHYNRPVIILSGFRCPELNRLIGGAETSQHTLGEAADIHISGVKNDEVWNFINMMINFDQLIAEKLKKDNGMAGWIHVSHKREGTQRGESLSFLGDKYIKGLHYMEDL